MKKKNLSAKEALSFLLAGYVVEGEGRTFLNRQGKVVAQGRQDRLVLDRYRFLELFADSAFQLSEEGNSEELCDARKDEEYYSFRQ